MASTSNLCREWLLAGPAAAMIQEWWVIVWHGRDKDAHAVVRFIDDVYGKGAFGAVTERSMRVYNGFRDEAQMRVTGMIN